MYVFIIFAIVMTKKVEQKRHRFSLR